MTEGLITRIGRWLDHHWEAKATESMVMERWNDLENSQIKDKLDLQVQIKAACVIHEHLIKDLQDGLKALRAQVSEVHQTTYDPTKDLADLKTRIEKIELYSGMTRKIDPMKPPVVKSAFSM